MASTTGIFENPTLSMELYSTWNKRRQELERKRLQPYSEILLDNIVWPEVLEKKDEILAALKEKCATAEHRNSLFVSIWTFNHVLDYPRGAAPVGTIGHGIQMQEGNQNAYRAKQIRDGGWSETICVDEDTEDGYYLLYTEPIYNIINKTDFCAALSQKFGSSFWVTLSVKERIAVDGEGFTRFVFSLNLHYFPNGLHPVYKKKRDDFLAAADARTRRLLCEGEKLVHWKGYEKVIRPPAPLFPASRFSQAPCHCDHCGYDSD